MSNKIIISASILIIFFIALGCSPQAPGPITQKPPETTEATAVTVPPPTTAAPVPMPQKQPSGPIKGTWIDASVDGDAVSIPVNAIYDAWDTHFKIQDSNRTLTFMAYLWNNNIYVRANVCPPCRSIGFSLKGDILVCDTCGTTFQAKTGAGIKGACVAYPKASVQYKTVDNNIVMSVNDLVSAYNKTQKG